MFFLGRTWLIVFCLAAVAACRPVFANAKPASERLESQLLADAADGRLDDFTLCEAAAIAGGCETRQEVSRRLGRFETLCASAAAQVSLGDPPRERAAALLACLHRESLTGPYQADDWQIIHTLESGRYNCLTATILYQALCRRFDLSVSAVSYPGHVACQLHEEPPLDVETTCTRWFELDAKARGELGRPAALRREIGEVQLVAKVYYNRGLALLAENRYAPAVECLRASRRLDPLDGAARENELAALNNWALSLVAAGKYEEAALRIREGLALDPSSPRLLESEAYIHRRSVEALESLQAAQ